MLPEIKKMILSRWMARSDNRVPPGPLSFLRVGLHVNVPNEGAATFLGFEPGRPHPCLVVKVAKDPAFSPGIRGEYKNLQTIRDLTSHADFVNIPEPLDLFEVDECAVLVQSFLRGRPMSSELDLRGGFLLRRRTQREMDLVARWQGLCVYLSSAKACPVSATWASERVQAFRSRFDLTDTEDRFLDCIAASTKPLGLHLSPAHGDFCAGNLLCDGEKVCLVDWSFFQTHAPPLLDYVSFVITRNLIGSEKSWHVECALGEGRSPDESTWYGVLVRRHAEKICDSLSIPRSALQVVWGLALVAGAIQERSTFGPRPAVDEKFRKHFAVLAEMQ